MLQTAAKVTETPGQPAEPKRSGEALRKAQQSLRKILAHRERCRHLARPSHAEVANLVAQFLARGGQVTMVPAGHAASIQNGAGRDADRWTL